MKKMMKRIGSVLLAAAMMAALGVTGAFAATDTQHEITISNADQYVVHSYEAYKVFSGNLNAAEDKLSDIAWGDGVNGPGLLTALQGATDSDLTFTQTQINSNGGKDVLGKAVVVGDSYFKNCETPQEVARVIDAYLQSTNGATDSAGGIDAVGTIISQYLTNKATAFTPDANANPANSVYKATVTGDGYYFIKDTTANLKGDKGSDSRSKYLLSIIKDSTIVAKDIGNTPEKKTGDATQQTVKAGTKSVGDTAYFKVEIEVPNTRRYEDHFFFIMHDKLPPGITFTGIESVTIDTETITDVNKATGTVDLTNENYTGDKGYYTLKVDNVAPTYNNGYAFEANTYDAVVAQGGQEIELTFNQFKKFVETKGLIGKTVTVIYKGVVNDDAAFSPTGVVNEVEFKYSSDPNHVYDGDNPKPTDPVGETPKSKTRHYTTSLKVEKVNEKDEALEGATFKLEGSAMNRTMLTGYKYEPTDYQVQTGEVIDTSKFYWELKDGRFTDQDPATPNMNTTQYVNTNQKYYRVNFDRDVVKTSATEASIVTGNGGIAEFVGINEGSYTLTEPIAPEGYNKLTGNLEFQIKWADPEGNAPTNLADDTDLTWDQVKAQDGYYVVQTSATGSWGTVTWDATNKLFRVKIENRSGSQLPSTGGIGTYVFTIAGVAIMAIAAGLLVIRHKKKAE